MKRLLIVKLRLRGGVWECGNPCCGFPHFHTRDRWLASDAVTWGRGRRRAAFYSRFLVIGPDHRAACRSHRWGGAISVTTIGVVEAQTALAPPSRGRCQARRGRLRRGQSPPSKVDPSRQIAYRMRLKRRAKATTAIRRPRRPASRSAQARRVALPPARQQTHAACTRSARSSPGPALVM